MVHKVVVTLICDYCDKTSDDIEEHVITVDGTAPISVDSCAGCWQERESVLRQVMQAGRSKKIADRQRARAKAAVSSDSPRTGRKTTTATPDGDVSVIERSTRGRSSSRGSDRAGSRGGARGRRRMVGA
ncbi:hypothetical protein [Nocardioides sp. Leaf285]|uniref:hypothetical protein n=1 Tax=Nocardioides sp. Leaf285 TaxID=1736322 RepID=UPI0012EA54DB|nr:hypothetical protein [Nocardioides sp. Leaf285]